MADHGAAVVATDEPDLAGLRADLGVPATVNTCHVGLIDGYAIEGHVPAEAIARLLGERPDAVGIAVNGMPADAPGMGGDATTWAAQDVLLMGRDGSLTPFPYGSG